MNRRTAPTGTMTAAEYQHAVALRTSEAAWQAQVLRVLRTTGWKAFHITQSTTGGYSGRLRGDSDTAGWPDTWGWRIDHTRPRAALVFLELKRAGTPAVQRQQLTVKQRAVLADLDDVALITQGCDNLHVLSGVLRPTDSDLLLAIAQDPWSVTQEELEQG